MLQARKGTAVKAEQKKLEDGERPKKKSRRQGGGKQCDADETQKIPEAVAKEAERFIREQLQPLENAADDYGTADVMTWESTTVTLCGECRKDEVDYFLPMELFALHDLCRHQALGVKLSAEKLL